VLGEVVVAQLMLDVRAQGVSMKFRKMVIISLSFLLLILSMSLRASTTFKIERVDGTEIKYYLKTSKPHQSTETLLVIIQGSDCNSVYHNKLINSQFSSVIPSADILTVEKYGIDSNLKWDDNPERKDCPKDYIVNDSAGQRVDDYQQVLDYLNQNGQYKRVVLLGGSEGAVIANILTSKSSHVDLTISLNGGGRWFIDDVLHSIKVQSSSNESYNESANGFIGFSKHVLTSEPFELEMSGHGYKWWRSMFEIDQTLVLEKITTPVLIIQAESDLNVSGQLAQIQADMLTEIKPNFTYKTYSDLDHSFQLPDGTSKVDTIIHDIKLWLAQP